MLILKQLRYKESWYWRWCIVETGSPIEIDTVFRTSSEGPGTLYKPWIKGISFELTTSPTDRPPPDLVQKYFEMILGVKK